MPDDLRVPGNRMQAHAHLHPRPGISILTALVEVDIQVLLNIHLPRHFVLWDCRRWDAIIAVCLSSAFHTTKAALPGMLAAGWGRIINTGSMHALVASPYKSAYNAAKHGIAGERSLNGSLLAGHTAGLPVHGQ